MVERDIHVTFNCLDPVLGVRGLERLEEDVNWDLLIPSLHEKLKLVLMVTSFGKTKHNDGGLYCIIGVS